MSEVHISFYNLKDSFKHSGCPICHLKNKSGLKYIENILYEGVNNKEINELFKNSYGLCDKHAKKLLKQRDALGISIIYKRLLDNIIIEINKNNINHTIKKYKDIKIKQNKNCPICKIEKDAESRYINVFKNHIKDLLSYFKNSESTFCIEHFIKILILLNKENKNIIKKILEIQISKYNKLSLNLNKLIDSYDYLYNDLSLSEKEKKSYIDIVKIISGE